MQTRLINILHENCTISNRKFLILHNVSLQIQQEKWFFIFITLLQRFKHYFLRIQHFFFRLWKVRPPFFSTFAVFLSALSRPLLQHRKPGNHQKITVVFPYFLLLFSLFLFIQILFTF